jgi:hypothetical protein
MMCGIYIVVLYDTVVVVAFFFRLYISLSEIFHCFHNNLNSTTKELKPTIFEISTKNFTPCVEVLEVTSGWLFTSACLSGEEFLTL